MSDTATMKRLRRLEDLETLRRLMARYCAACDDDHDPERVAALFTEDGTWEAEGVGRFEGREAIRGYMAGLRASGSIRKSAHNVFNPDIEVDGDEARGHWRLLMLYTANVPGGGTQYFRVIGSYRTEYVREAGSWLHRSLHCTVDEHGPYSVEADRTR